MTRYCMICGLELQDDSPIDICLDCQSIMSQGVQYIKKIIIREFCYKIIEREAIVC